MMDEELENLDLKPLKLPFSESISKLSCGENHFFDRFEMLLLRKK